MLNNEFAQSILNGFKKINFFFQIQPKCCRRIRIPIYALSLHARLHEDESVELSGGPFNELRLMGGFTVAEVTYRIIIQRHLRMAICTDKKMCFSTIYYTRCTRGCRWLCQTFQNDHTWWRVKRLSTTSLRL